ncbi:MAG TPA: hypothetical protein H9745_03520 [Candidatus Agathobaculum stercoravium]|nr:hypothetical protein [Candidatus Agathobaculum stercoravium]
MAKNKVINTVLNLRDNMSGGLLKAAQNAKKAGAQIDSDMLKATRQVVAFKNKAVDSITSFAKKATTAGVAGVTALTTAFFALDNVTEEYRIAQGKLNTAFDAAGFSATAARKSYRNFYAILGDTDTATEASQLLAKLVKNEQDVSTWTRIAAGVSGTFGDSLPIEGLIEASNETAKVGTVTGQLADALNWAGIMEDDFNTKLAACGSESERNKLIMDTLAQTYEGAADAFYRNNEQLVRSRQNQAIMADITAKLGTASAIAKNGVMQLLGAQEDGSIRAGSALEWLNEKATQFSDWVAGLDMGALSAQFDQQFGGAIETAGNALQWCKENGDLLIGGLKLLAGAFVAVKVVTFTSSLISAGQTIGGFISTIAAMTTATTAQTAATGSATIAQTGLNAALAANPIGVVVLAITALVTAGVALYKNWDTIKAAASQLWTRIKQTFGGIKDSIVGAFNSAKDAVGSFFSWIGDKLSWLDNKVESIPILGSVYKGGKALVGGAADFIGSLIGGNALGTSYWKGGLTRVNERGGEILNLPSGTQIIPHDVSKRVAGGQTVQVYVTVQGNIIGNRQYADELGETIVQRILRALDNM